MIPESDLFNPEHYKAVRKPLLEAETMPAWCYTSPQFYKREVDRIWKKVWNFIGSADQCAKAGDYFTQLQADFVSLPQLDL
jgi:choline monooxygenase